VAADLDRRIGELAQLRDERRHLATRGRGLSPDVCSPDLVCHTSSTRPRPDRPTGPLTVELRQMTVGHLIMVQPWFDDPDTRRFLGGPDWPARRDRR
jgi:hypothetical protein